MSESKQVMVNRKKSVIFNWDYVGFFLLLFGFVLVLIGFWRGETILWNHIKYTTGNGSQWQNANPIYMLNPINELKYMIKQNLIFYVIGNFLFLVCFGFMVFQYARNVKWFNTSKLYLILFTVGSGLSAILSFWQYMSLSVIEGLPALGGTVSGYEWIRVLLTPLSNIIEVFSIYFMVTSLIIFISLIVIMVLNRENMRTEEKTVKTTSFSDVLKGIFKSIPLYIVLLVYIVFTVFPIYLAIRASISNAYEIKEALRPSEPIKNMILNYSSVLFAISVEEPSFIVSLKNSIFLGVGTSVIGLTVSITSAYGLARFKFRAKTFLTFLILSTQMFPGIILLIPQYVILSDLGFIENTNLVLIGLLIVMSTGSTAYVTWMMKGYFETIPIDMEEAAQIDGYSRFQSFFKIAIPLARAGIVAVMVFTFLGAWQEFVLARTFIRTNLHINGTLPLLFYNYQDLAQPDQPTFYELLSPYGVLVAMPVVLFYMLLQRQLVGGATAGGIK